MKKSSFIFFVLLLKLAVGEYETKKCSSGILGNLILKALESLKPNLTDLHINEGNFETGLQEFGNLKGHFGETIVNGLEKFNVTKIDTSFFDVNNLTIVENNFTAKGRYNINGSLVFPLGKNDIGFFGNGDFGAEFINFSVSMKIKLRYDNGKKVVKDFNMSVGLEKLKVYFKNLMGGGELEIIFNQLLNDVGLTVFNYYKKPVLDALSSEIINFINQILNKK